MCCSDSDNCIYSFTSDTNDLVNQGPPVIFLNSVKPESNNLRNKIEQYCISARMANSPVKPLCQVRHAWGYETEIKLNCDKQPCLVCAWSPAR